MSNSPYPDSFFGNPILFGYAVFALILMTLCGLMLAPIFGKQLWLDRHDGATPSNAFCWTVFAICSAMTMRCGPEVLWMINYADLTPLQRTSMANVKRIFDAIALVPVVIWVSTLVMYKDEIILRLKAPYARIWNDHRFTPLKRVVPLAFLCFAFALFVTLGRAYA